MSEESITADRTEMGIRRRWRWARRELDQLDPGVDHERMTHLWFEVRLGDPLIVAALYTLAFARQMAVPSIARVVHRGGGGDIIRETRARNDLTLNFFGRFMRSGHSSRAGREAIAELNAIHARFKIEDHESLYTLASLAFEGPRISDRLGVQLADDDAYRANYRFWAGVAQHMDRILPVPPYEEFLRWTLDYERQHYAYTPGGRAVVDAMLDDFAARLPAPLRGLGRRVVIAGMDDRLREAHRLPSPRIGSRSLAMGARLFSLFKSALPDPGDRSWADHFSAPERQRALGGAQAARLSK